MRIETHRSAMLLRMREVMLGTHKPPHAEERAEARVSKRA
jgi:hypothetical protein